MQAGAKSALFHERVCSATSNSATREPQQKLRVFSRSSAAETEAPQMLSVSDLRYL
jgi:hypothetical protein